MRAIIQRVNYAKLYIDEKLYSEINNGLLVYLGVHKEDKQSDLDYMVRKVTGLRVFDDVNSVMNLSIKDISGDIMIVSQFTLYGDVRKGNRPNYMMSAKGDFAKKIYNQFITEIKKQVNNVSTGVFGEDMKIEYSNDGPVTIQLDSSKLY